MSLRSCMIILWCAISSISFAQIEESIKILPEPIDPIEKHYLGKESCATAPMTEKQVKYLLNVVDKMGAQRNGTLTAVPIRAHIVRMSDGSGGLTTAQLNLAVSYLNFHYYDAGIEYFVANINYIDNTTFYNYDTSEEAALCSGEEVNDAVNVFFVNSIAVPGGYACGYAYYPFDATYTLRVLMDNSCTYTFDNGTFPHELGHFFNLAHTHNGTSSGPGSSNAEHVPRSGPNSNCTTDGDYLCDTEADPAQPGICVYNLGESDIYGNPYDPDETNIMSYYSDACGGIFTPEQYIRMANGLATRLTHNSYNLTGASPMVVTNPSGTAAVLNTTYGIDVSWTDNSSNEYGFLVEKSSDGGTTFTGANGGGLDENITAYTNSEGLSSFTTYDYRIKASNDDPNDYSNTASVTTGLLYCVPTVSNSNCVTGSYGTGIKNFELTADANSIDNASGCDALSVYTSSLPAAQMNIDLSYNFEVQLLTQSGSYYPQNISIWMDKNQDGDFDDTDEQLYESNFSWPGFQTISGSILIPNSALNGNTTLRVRSRHLNSGIVSNPCGYYSNGETEDYGINIFGAPLPVELLSFSGQLKEDYVELNWASITEIENAFYMVERSRDGINFEEIIRIDGHGNTFDITNYSTLDTEPHIGENLYRLNQYDLDGSHAYLGDIISVQYLPKLRFNVFPNPGFTDRINMVSTASHGSQVRIEIINFSGRLVHHEILDFSAQLHVQELDVEQLASGLYYILVHTGQTVEKIKYVKI